MDNNKTEREELQKAIENAREKGVVAVYAGSNNPLTKEIYDFVAKVVEEEQTSNTQEILKIRELQAKKK